MATFEASAQQKHADNHQPALPTFQGVSEEVDAAVPIVQAEENVNSQSKLNGSFTFWYRYGDNVEEFWCYYDHIKRLADVHESADIHLFRQGIPPMWEDESNAHGARLIIRSIGSIFARYWEELLLNFIGEQFNPHQDEICGVSLNVRPGKSSSIAVWIKNSRADAEIEAICLKLQEVLCLPNFCNIEIKQHKKEGDSGHDNKNRGNAGGRGHYHHHREGNINSNKKQQASSSSSSSSDAKTTTTTPSTTGGEKKNWQRAAKAKT